MDGFMPKIKFIKGDMICITDVVSMELGFMKL